MRRTYKAIVDVRTTDGLEFSRPFSKNYMDIVKRLDEQKNRASSVSDIFTPSGEVLRAKLKDYCEKLILKDPLAHARKLEELLWRKGFYEIAHAAKKLRKNNTWNEAEKALLYVHLTVGVGFYHHLVLTLQSEFHLNLTGIIDFPFMQNESTLSDSKHRFSKSRPVSEETKECLMRLIHRSLVCLGDLERYRLDLEPNWDPMIAKRYYKMAIAIYPNIGMPHNQLGTVASRKNYGLDAVYHYMRCVLCTESFEGAEGNLKRAIALHSVCADEAPAIYRCISKLMSLLQLWDFEMPNSDRVNQECQDLLNHIENCFNLKPTESANSKSIANEDNIDVYLQNCKNEETGNFTGDILFKILAICLMSISRLKSKESTEVQGVIAITLAILSQLVQFVISRLQETFVEKPMSNMDVDSNVDSPIKLIEHDEIVTDKETTDTIDVSRIIYNQTVMNNSVDFNDNKKNAVSESSEAINNDYARNNAKKACNKTSSLLTKLRRPRKRRNSSDSDASDIENATVASSSDEINSEISESEDVHSEKNELSDDALSEDVSDDEGATKTNGFQKPACDESNNHVNQENVAEGSININGVKNGDHLTNDNQSNVSLKSDSEVNSESAVATVENVEPNSAYDESKCPRKTMSYIAQLKKQSLSAQDVLNRLEGIDAFASIKICFDWLASNQDVIRTCAKSSKILLERITVLLNLINLDTEQLCELRDDEFTILQNADALKEFAKVIPLPEDIDLRGVNVINGAQKCLNWKILHKRKIGRREEMLLRVLKLVDFGHKLSSMEESHVKYDESKRLFLFVDSNSCDKTKDPKVNSVDLEAEHPRKKLMRHMGRLWLKAEVRALESSLHSRLMSPYLVPDHEALIKHTATLKRLAFTKKFVIVIPAVVISTLDEVKRISAKAREATRWLEAQLRRGSRFLRAQRPHESLLLPLIKGPRPKDKEAWLFFQIIECCHYLTQQTKIGLSSEADAPVVTLLTGCTPDEKRVLNFSPDGLAKSAGVNLEYIESFHTKWKTSSKSHG